MQEIKIDLRELNRYFQERFPKKDLITFEELLNDYEELIFDKERLEEEIEELKNQENFNPDEEYGISDRDFI